MTPERARQVLRAAGLRCTAARAAILRCLHDCAAPTTPIEVAAQLSDFSFDKSTIYRALTELSDAGIIHRLDLGDSVRRFEIVSEDTNDDHPHFMCTDCGEVICLPDFRVELKSSGQQVSPGQVSEVLVRGHCHSCLAAD